MKQYLAPLEGMTSHILRNAIAHHYGGFDKYFTPFITSATMNHREREDVDPAHNKGVDVVPQIMSNNVREFLDIAKSVSSRGYKTVNLNLGCPSKTVVGKHRGSGFLSVPDELENFLSEIFDKCPLNISIKTRIGMNDITEWPGIVEIYKKYPMDELIIHPRIQKEFYKGSPHMEEFIYGAKLLKETGIPLVYNGDIVDLKSYDNLMAVLRENKLDNISAVMIGRGAMALPMIGRDLKDYGDVSVEAGSLSGHNSAVEAGSLSGHNSALEDGFVQGMKSSSVVSENIDMASHAFLNDAAEVNRFWAFHDEILQEYTQVMSGDTPTLFKMKELWVYWQVLFQDVDGFKKIHKKILKSKRLSDYKAAISEIVI
ncbi:MAG: tRNA-dihydrouridine synthase family protein [Lachnospiraceae bacterium]|nr:tRNA-dihydrouridine synthase family protein [Lachnospiraceae bacterium]